MTWKKHNIACTYVQAILATEEVTQWRTAELVARSLSEYVSIVAAASLFTFGHVTGALSTRQMHAYVHGVNKHQKLINFFLP